MKAQPRIFAFHLLNDRSGSPKVLGQIIKSWVKEGREVHLYTSLHQDGFLSHMEGVHYHDGWYRYRSNPWLRLVFYSLSQIILIFKMLGQVKKTDTLYINTVLPFGGALVGKLKGCRVIYHIHESTVTPEVLKWFLLKVVSWTASDIINVSRYVSESHGITQVPNHLVYNAIDESFLSNVQPKGKNEKPSHVLMVCSLKAYKGIYEFIKFAKDNSKFSYQLVLNASQAEIDSFFSGHQFPQNLEIFPSQKNLHPFFQWADVIVNLSRPDQWIETFGLTIIEGMAYGLPAIVPPVGGILEVIEEGVTGYSVDPRDRKALNKKLLELMDNPIYFNMFSKASLKRLELFREKTMLEQINGIV